MSNFRKGIDSSQCIVFVPREEIGDDEVLLGEWLAEDGVKVQAGQPIAVLETGKATFEVEAVKEGFLFHLAEEGASIRVGAPLALISDTPDRPHLETVVGGAEREQVAGGQIITQKAKNLIQKHGISMGSFAEISVVRASDVEEFLRREGRTREEQPTLMFGDEKLDPEADLDSILATDEYKHIMQLMTALRQRMKAKHNRHVPSGDLLYDRWQLAKDYRFGEETSVYDQCSILGNVKVGKDCWIGPFTVLDGYHAPLVIGDHTSIGAGSQIYTHNTIARRLSGRAVPLFSKPTTIGNCCFIAPMGIIAPGTEIGDHCFVAAGSYVEGKFAPYSYIAGNPAKQVGVVEIRGKRVTLRRSKRNE